MAKVGRLSVVVTAGTAGLTRGLRASERAVDRFVGRAGKASSVIGGQMRKGINSGGTALAAFGASATAGAVAAGIAIKQGADRIDDLADSSKRLLGNNGATGALAGLRFAAEEAGVEMGMVDKGMEKMLDTISKAGRGQKSAIEAFENIGVSVRDLQRLRPEQQMVMIADAIGRVGNQADKISFARGIFGKAGGGMVPLFNEGGEAIRAATRDMEMFGHSVTAIDAEKVGTMNDNIGRMKLAWEGAGMQLATHFAPLVTDVSDRLLNLIDDSNGVGGAVDNAFRYGVGVAGEFLDALESVEIGWNNVRWAIAGQNGALMEGIAWLEKWTGVSALAARQEEERRIAMIAPDKQDEFRRRLDESGGFQRDRLTSQGIADELNRTRDEASKREAEIQKRRREEGTLGTLFKNWERTAQAKGATNAAAKLADASVTRLEAEEAITDEAEKQTKEKKEQLRLEQGGQGKFALMAFNGVTGAPAGGTPAKADKEKGVVAAALAETGGPVAIAASSEQDTAPVVSRAAAPPPMLARNAEQRPVAQAAAGGFGSKEYWDGVIFGGGTEQASGGHSMLPDEPKWKSKQLTPDRARNYESKRPEPSNYVERDPISAAVNANPMATTQAKPADMTKVEQLLESIDRGIKGGMVGRLA